jgi:Kef-type K+ transport system membrane component KefB
VVGINLLWLALILMSARLFAPLAQRIGFPAVLGELLLGVALGNLALLGFTGFEAIPKDPIIAFIAELGVIVLLLQIGLETRLADLIKVGPRAFAVGTVGIVVPFVLGTWVVGPWLLPGLSNNAYLSSAPRCRRPRSASPGGSSATWASSTRRRRASCSARR